ncbi:uncharacterized protein UBRO_03643 [Ustilago bromivora]|uniref:Transcription factor domain-containing protein n=1 Tax=Ustilago bromivora TaxID=307758 RepID=A0A1K0G6D9_9BASI|nr:uncharacterized protein UBRO_03643 [Ustilago bromivora]SYW75515.1 uncharacterized protein UBRO2_00749 [Ustilago bromivora]
MPTSSQGMVRKRTCADPCSSSQTIPKHPRIASASSSTSSFASPATSSVKVACNQSSHLDANTKARSDSISSQASSFSDSSLSSSATLPSTSSVPFPRYSLGIPHLDLLLPIRDGLDLLHAYHQGIGWIQTPVDRTTLLETLEQAERHGADSIHPHRLACLLAALALGDLFSPCFPTSCNSHHPAQPSQKRGKIWLGVASACLAGSRTDNELTLQPTPDACSALYLMSTYLLCANDEELFNRSQGLTGLALVLAKAALVPSCLPSAASTTQPSRLATLSPSNRQEASFQTPQAAYSSPASPSQSASSLLSAHKASTDHDRLHCNKLLSDIIFHLRSQVLTFALPSTATQTASPTMPPSLANFPDVPTIQAIWTAYGTPLYASLDAFGNRYSPNIFHNWKLGLADLMHQVSLLTNQALPFDNLAAPLPSSQSAGTLTENSEADQPKARGRILLPDHSQVVKLDERIRRYHASLPDFLLLHRPLPIDMAGKVDTDELDQIVCQRHMACSMVHRMLMALHRPWFLAALACRSGSARANTVSKANGKQAAEQTPATLSTSTKPSEAVSEAAAPLALEQPSPSAMFSLFAVLRSATWQTETFASAAACAPPQALAWWQFTNNALAAAIVQATALLRLSCPTRPSSATAGGTFGSAAERPGSSSHFHSQMRTDLDKNICSFQNVAKRCKLAAKALPFLQRVGSAIDLGLCKPCGQDPLQTNLSPSQTPHHGSQLDSSPFATGTSAPTPPGHNNSEPFSCNNSIRTNISPSISTSNSISTNNSTSISNSIDHNSIHSSSNSTTICKGLDSNKTAPAHSTQPGSAESSVDSSYTGPRRASSAKSKLETIFGPIASGLELPQRSDIQAPASSSSSSVKPLYRQSLDPLPVPPNLTRDGDEHSSQPSFSEDAGSSSSSGIFPGTPGSQSPLMGARETSLPATQQKGPDKASIEGPAAQSMSNQASDLVLQCIRFWQPDMLATPAPPA